MRRKGGVLRTCAVEVLPEFVLPEALTGAAEFVLLLRIKAF
jgi:hypothetical protein